MSSLVVGGVAIPVAISSPTWSRSDAVDRGRLFDNSYFASQTGGAANDWQFSTPPVTTALAAIYKAVLSIVAPQLCSGDILELPTMCYAELLAGNPRRKASGHNVVLNFMLHEVQSARMLLRYSPGDTITGESFSRSTVASYYDVSGVLQSAAINVKRDGHYIGGIRSILLEDARTNLIIRSRELENAAWTATATVTANAATSPDGAATAENVNDTSGAATQEVHQTITVANDAATRTGSIFLKAGSSSIAALSLIYTGGTQASYGIVVNLATGATLTQAGITAPSLVQVTALGSGWYRIAISGANNGLGNTSLSLYVYPAWNSSFLAAFSNAATGSVNAWGAQIENGAFASSYIYTTAAAVTRTVDSESLPHTVPPGESSFYLKFVESGTLLSAHRLFQISNAANATPELLLTSTGSFYEFQHIPVGTVKSTLAVAPAIGDTVEIVARLFGDGSVDITQSINGAASTTAAQSAAATLATAWSGSLVWLNSDGALASAGFTALQSFKIISGARSLDDMRAA